MPSPESPLAPGRPDKPFVALALVLAAGVLFSVSDACSKLLTATLPPIEIAWLRWSVFTLIALPVMAASRGRVLRSRAPGLQTLRAVSLLGSSVLFISGLLFLPLADAISVSFVSPLIVTALSIPLLGERVGPRRWAAVLVGLLGVLIVVRPGTGALGPAAALPFLSACFWAVAVLATRKLGGIDPPWTAMCWGALIGLGVLSLLVIPVFVRPSLFELAVAAGLGATSTLAQYFIVQGFGRGQASVLAPLSYAQMIWSVLLGYALFGNVPDGPTWIGAAVIIGSGIYIAHRERVRAREAART